MKVLRADQYVAVPWRNGGGATREIAACRDSRRHDDFLWRLSIATVAQSGPFSRFDGVDRTIAVLEGGRMSLHISDCTTTLGADTPPFSFSGDEEVLCELVGPPTVDLNAMTRRGFFGHSLRKEKFLGWLAIEGSADHTFVVSSAVLELFWHGRAALGPLDTIADIGPGERFELYSDQPAEILIVEVRDMAGQVSAEDPELPRS